jgi:pantoate--beta-alanine ligase
MQVFEHIQTLHEALAKVRRQHKSICLVPTMGNLHEGHMALVKIAQAHCDWVVVSIFVNPLQFALNEDWDMYPRTYADDLMKLRAVGCDCLFYPHESEMYPNGISEQTKVIVPTMANILCGKSRPSHFDGVTTVVAKLFHIVQPDESVFGLKDFQQLAIIRRMVQDLCLPIKITAGDIVREDDGLAMSSRNRFIADVERATANQLYRTLCWMKSEIEQGSNDYLTLECLAKEQIIAAGFRPDYIQICNSTTLQPAADDNMELAILGAMYTKSARLIDNVSILRQRQ